MFSEASPQETVSQSRRSREKDFQMELLPYVWDTEEMFVIRSRGHNMAGHRCKQARLKSGAYLKIFHGYISDRLCKLAPLGTRLE